MSPSALEQTNCLRAGKIFPHKKALLSAVPIKGIVRFGWQFLRFALTARICYPERHASTTTTRVVVVHSCLQLRLIRHEWGASFFDVGASLKNCSCRLKEQSHASPSALKQTNCLRVGKIFPHKKALLSAVPIKGIVRFGWQFLRFASIAWVCYPERHVSITTTHVL